MVASRASATADVLDAEALEASIVILHSGEHFLQ